MFELSTLAPKWPKTGLQVLENIRTGLVFVGWLNLIALDSGQNDELGVGTLKRHLRLDRNTIRRLTHYLLGFVVLPQIVRLQVGLQEDAPLPVVLAAIQPGNGPEIQLRMTHFVLQSDTDWN